MTQREILEKFKNDAVKQNHLIKEKFSRDWCIEACLK